MLERLLKELETWNKRGEIMSKRPVAYFVGSSAKGEYAGWLKTKAWMETRLATQMLLEDEDGTFAVESKKTKEVYY